MLGLLIGVVVALVLFEWLERSVQPKGTALLRGFSFADVATNAGGTDWEVLEDKVYEPFPSLGRATRIARRMVAHATLPGEEQEKFAKRFRLAVSEALASHDAVIKGQFDLNRSSAHVVNGSPVQSLVDLPRFYYAIGDIHGVADAWCIGEGGGLTVIVSLIEGP